MQYIKHILLFVYFSTILYSNELKQVSEINQTTKTQRFLQDYLEIIPEPASLETLEATTPVETGGVVDINVVLGVTYD